jgi:hypothetical protein
MLNTESDMLGKLENMLGITPTKNNINHFINTLIFKAPSNWDSGSRMFKVFLLKA